MPNTNNATIEKSVKIIDGFLKHSEEDPCVHTFAQILDSIFDNENKTSGVYQPRQTPDVILTPSPKGNEEIT